MLDRQREVEEQIKELKREVKKYPKGELVLIRNGKYQKWYRSFGFDKEIIPKKNRQLAEKLAQKKYLETSIEYLEREENAIEMYLNRHPNNESRLLWVLDEKSKYDALLLNYSKPLSKNIPKDMIEWMNEPFETNPYKLEKLVHVTESGKYVRSKSEVYIYSLLSKYKIPFRYEAKLELGNNVYYPDFTIKHPKSGEVFYWEHFGSMYNPKYIKRFMEKIEKYISNGIIPGVNLIMTFETQDKPLNVDKIIDIIESYFSN